MRRSKWLAMTGALVLGGIATTGAAQAACTIASSPCYPWRIEAGQGETVLLEIVPNNVSTAALYRVCLCPPTESVSLVFDFEGRQVPIGTVATSTGETICRDYRLQTARKSRLLLKRTEAGAGAGGAKGGVVEGCYTTQ